MTDLWGKIEPVQIKTPVSILREQGALLEEKTKGILTVRIGTSQIGKNNETRFVYSFIIHVPTLNYSYHLFHILHDITLYPVQFEIINSVKVAKDENEFLDILGEILKSPETQKIINALLSQSVTA